jgi:hypothetical protein
VSRTRVRALFGSRSSLPSPEPLASGAEPAGRAPAFDPKKSALQPHSMDAPIPQGGVGWLPTDPDLLAERIELRRPRRPPIPWRLRRAQHPRDRVAAVAGGRTISLIDSRLTKYRRRIRPLLHPDHNLLLAPISSRREISGASAGRMTIARPDIHLPLSMKVTWRCRRPDPTVAGFGGGAGPIPKTSG